MRTVFDTIQQSITVMLATSRNRDANEELEKALRKFTSTQKVLVPNTVFKESDTPVSDVQTLIRETIRFFNGKRGAKPIFIAIHGGSFPFDIPILMNTLLAELHRNHAASNLPCNVDGDTVAGLFVIPDGMDGEEVNRVTIYNINILKDYIYLTDIVLRCYVNNGEYTANATGLDGTSVSTNINGNILSTVFLMTMYHYINTFSDSEPKKDGEQSMLPVNSFFVANYDYMTTIH